MVDRKVKYVMQAMQAHIDEDYYGMQAAMKVAVETGVPFDENELKLLETSYSDLIKCRKNAWSITATIASSVADSTEARLSMAQNAKNAIATDVQNLCFEFLNIIIQYVLPKSNTKERYIYSCKLFIDYLTIVGEVNVDREVPEFVVAKCSSIYDFGISIVNKYFSPTDPLRLAMAFSYANFLFRLVKQPKKAHDVALNGFLAAYYLEQRTGLVAANSPVMHRLGDIIEITTRPKPQE